MFPTLGLRTHIWNNVLKSALLLAGFPILLLLITFAFALLAAAANNPSVEEGIAEAIRLLPRLVPIAFGAALLWFVIAYFANQAIVDLITGARPVTRAEEPRLWNLLENLAISRGLKTPTVRIIETEAMNAYANGVREGQYSVTVTRGLIEALDDAELEAVLAHELTHIRNRDVQLLMISAVFVGVISLAADLTMRTPRFAFGAGRRSSQRKGGKGGGAAILILMAIAIFIIARLLAVVLRFALSRKREYLADAGAVELTKNPDSMASALRKIEGRAQMEAPAQIREMFFHVPRTAGFAGLFETHPSIEDRIGALVAYAGAHDPGPIAPSLAEPVGAPATMNGVDPAPPANDAVGEARPAGPWG